MPKVKVNDITIDYEQQGLRHPLSSTPISPPRTPVTRSGRRLRQAFT